MAALTQAVLMPLLLASARPGQEIITAGCSTDDDCSLLGICVGGGGGGGGECRCDPGWTGRDCAAAALQPYDDVAGLGYVNSTSASWGGRPLKIAGEWQLFATEIAARQSLFIAKRPSEAEETFVSP